MVTEYFLKEGLLPQLRGEPLKLRSSPYPPVKALKKVRGVLEVKEYSYRWT
jgi:hypothetical protein